MLGFYAEAYEAAIGGIMDIGDEFLDEFFPLADQNLSQFTVCEDDLEKMKDKTMEDLINDEWEDFSSNLSEGGTILGTGIANRNKVEKYYKEQAKIRILKCCIDLLDLD